VYRPGEEDRRPLCGTNNTCGGKPADGNFSLGLDSKGKLMITRTITACFEIKTYLGESEDRWNQCKKLNFSFPFEKIHG
jgi:hypothetical protein